MRSRRTPDNRTVRCVSKEKVLSDGTRPGVWLMIGVPYAGKSTYVASHPELSALPVRSFDDEIMHVTHGHYEKWAEAADRASEALAKSFVQ